MIATLMDIAIYQNGIATVTVNGPDGPHIAYCEAPMLFDALEDMNLLNGRWEGIQANVEIKNAFLLSIGPVDDLEEDD